MGTVVNSRTRVRERPVYSVTRDNGWNWENQVFGGTAGGSIGVLSKASGSAVRVTVREQRVTRLEPIKEAPTDRSTPDLAATPAQDTALVVSGAKGPETASLTVFKGNLRKRWSEKMQVITRLLDALQSKMFELLWVSILYLHYLYPQISRFVEYVSGWCSFSSVADHVTNSRGP